MKKRRGKGVEIVHKTAIEGPAKKEERKAGGKGRKKKFIAGRRFRE